MKKDGKDVEGGRCMRGSDSRLSFSEKDRGKVWKEHMERIINEENEWDQNVEADLVEGPVERVSREEVVKAMGEMKAGKAAGPSEGVLDGKGMPDEWAMSVVVPIFKGKGDAMRCGAYRGVKLLEHAMKIIEKVLERTLQCMVIVDKMQFSVMPSKGTIDAVFILRRLQEKYLDKEKKLYTFFIDLEKAFDKVSRKVLEEERYTRGDGESSDEFV
ncbi:uncharacterized protein [Montipora capricornis]|uniref:uncharacterized protein n=1 Tax=Montipora capricornis TaxID=246305 RepID=UPI0035F1B142